MIINVFPSSWRVSVSVPHSPCELCRREIAFGAVRVACGPPVERRWFSVSIGRNQSHSSSPLLHISSSIDNCSRMPPSTAGWAPSTSEVIGIQWMEKWWQRATFEVPQCWWTGDQMFCRLRNLWSFKMSLPALFIWNKSHYFYIYTGQFWHISLLSYCQSDATLFLESVSLILSPIPLLCNV